MKFIHRNSTNLKEKIDEYVRTSQISQKIYDLAVQFITEGDSAELANRVDVSLTPENTIKFYLNTYLSNISVTISDNSIIGSLHIFDSNKIINEEMNLFKSVYWIDGKIRDVFNAIDADTEFQEYEE